MTENRKTLFALIDIDGNQRVPTKMRRRDGAYGYAVHPVGKGNDSSAATYTEDERAMVQAVVLHGCGVRSKAVGGPRDGQMSTLALGKRAIRGYWLCPSCRLGRWGCATASQRRGAGMSTGVPNTCSKCGGMRFNGWNRYVDCRNQRARAGEQCETRV